MGKDGRFDVAVTFDERRGYVGTHPELRAPVTALSLGGLRRKVEAAMLPEEVIVMLSLDKAARLEGGSSRCVTSPRLPTLTSPSIKPSMVDGSIRPMNRTVGNAYWRSRPVEPCAPSA